MKVAFYTLGCKLNYSETSQLREEYENMGHTIVPFGEPMDAIVINTCTVTENADTECRKIIRRALKVSPNAFVAVTGCYAQLQPEEIASIDGVDAVFGTSEKLKLHSLINDYTKRDTPVIHVQELDEVEFDFAQSADSDSRTRAFLKIQDGCNYNCSFCTIPLARGASRSLDFNEIAHRIQTLEQQGYHEIIISGINLGDYRSDQYSFVDVVKLINSLNTSIRFRLGSIEPNLVSDEIINLVAHSSVIVPHFHIPLQSGSPELLKLMRRRYKAEYYRDLVLKIKQAMPNACIGGDVIVGFPGETDELFEESFTFIENLPLTYLHVFTYSERENTPAAIFSGKIPIQKRKLRNARLRSLSDSKRMEFYRQQCGTKQIVIPETYDSTLGIWEGWTNNYVRCAFTADKHIIQQMYSVQLQDYNQDTGIVHGNMLDNPVFDSTKHYIPILL